MMTTEEVNEYLQNVKSSNTESATENNEPDAGLQPEEGSENGGNAGSPSAAEVGGATGEETEGSEGEKPEGAANKATTAEGGKPAAAGTEETLEKNKARWANSFRKEKEKRKRQKDFYENRIGVLQRENEELKRKMQGAKFDASEEGIQRMIDLKSNERELSRLESEREELQLAEDFEENERRIVECFPEENDRKIYKELLKNSGEKFAYTLEAYDKDNVVLNGLDDCDISPIVVRVLMTRPEFLNEILSKKTKHGKEIAFDNLVARLRVADRVIKAKKAGATTAKTGAPKQETKKGLEGIKPTGKQIKNSSEPAGEVEKDSNYWNNYLKEHPRGT